MTLSNFDNSIVDKNREGNDMSAAVAADYVSRMVRIESRQPGDTDGALPRIANRSGIGFWTLKHLHRRAAKTIAADVFGRLRNVYLDLCEREIRRLQAEIDIERAAGNADLEDFAAEAASLVARLQAARGIEK